MVKKPGEALFHKTYTPMTEKEIAHETKRMPSLKHASFLHTLSM